MIIGLEMSGGQSMLLEGGISPEEVYSMSFGELLDYFDIWIKGYRAGRREAKGKEGPPKPIGRPRKHVDNSPE